MLLQIAEQIKEDLSSIDATSTTRVLSDVGEDPTNKATTKGVAPKAVLQLNMIPAPIDITQYANPYSPANPKGDFLSLFRFRN